MPSDRYIKSEYKEVLFYLAIITFFGLILPILSGLIKKGFSESFVSGEPLTFGTYLANFTIYVPILLVALMCVIFPIARAITLKRGEHPAEKLPAHWFRIFTVSWIYAPEDGLLWYLSEQAGYKGKKNFMRWQLNVIRVIVVAVLLFGAYGLFLVDNPQIAISGVPQLQAQQFSVSSEVSFNSFVPASAENGLLLWIFMLLSGIIALISAKTKWGKPGFYLLGFLVCILMGFIWMGLHSLAYGNNDASLWATFFFGFLGSLITYLTGIFIYWFVWHIMNNMFITLSQLISFKEDILLIGWLIWGGILVLWLLVEIRNYSLRTKKGRVKKDYQQLGSDLSIPEG